MTTIDLYTTLGVPRDASPEQLDHAYRELAARYELAAGSGAEANARYRQIRYAYETLRDPERRRHYDESLLTTERHPHLSRNPVDRLTRKLPDPLRVAVDWIVTIVGAIAIVLAIKAFIVNPYRIPSSSMEPRLHCARPGSGCLAGYSDRVLANRFVYRLRDPKRGEIVVFETPPEAAQRCGAGGTFVKRLVGLPGETWEEREGVVYINGKPLEEPYLEPTRRDGQTHPPRKIGPDQYFFMGDNRSQSCDSRIWGAVPRGNLIGQVFATYWPPNRISFY